MMKSIKKRDGILKGLAELSASPFYPMHMPGHKRNPRRDNGLPYGIDITEIDGFDDLHDAKGILKEAMDRAGRLYGSERTWFLTCGATCGILATIGAVTRHNDRLIIARNCHISVFHAVEIKCLRAFYVMPDYNSEYGIIGSVSPSSVLEAVKACPKARAVVLTSPTYEGVISDIKEIAGICHEHGMPLIVDEAHGAHLAFYGSGKDSYVDASDVNMSEGESFKGVPYDDGGTAAFFARLSDLSALKAGADIVIDSAHKTLPALTQSAFLHLGSSEFVEETKIEEQLSIYETSSPSYVLMASLDECVDIIEKEGCRLFSEYESSLAKFSYGSKGLKRLKVLTFTEIIKPERESGGKAYVSAKPEGSYEDMWQSDKAKTLQNNACGRTEVYKEEKKHSEGIFAKDPGRILINGMEAGLAGSELARILREKYGIETEMSVGFNTVALTTVCDTEEGFDRFLNALVEIDRSMVSDHPNEPEALIEVEKGDAQDTDIYRILKGIFQERIVSEAEVSITEAIEADSRMVSYNDALNHTAAEYVYLYPPGIPLIVPGEIITERLLSFLESGEELLIKSRSRGKSGIIAVADQCCQ